MMMMMSAMRNSIGYSDRDDVVERFCTKHAEKIRNYVTELTRILPLPDLQLNDVAPAVELLNKSLITSNSK